jgi:hypothetical protein
MMGARRLLLGAALLVVVTSLVLLHAMLPVAAVRVRAVCCMLATAPWAAVGVRQPPQDCLCCHNDLTRPSTPICIIPLLVLLQMLQCHIFHRAAVYVMAMLTIDDTQAAVCQHHRSP